MGVSGNQKELASRQEDLRRIAEALNAANEVLRRFSHETLTVEFKGKDDPVTAVDRAINQRLWHLLPREDEGWLSEETTDDPSRLEKRRVWIVDPLDGTREFLEGVPEWCISIGLVEEGRAVAGGICNPATGELFLGSLETGVSLNGKSTSPRECRVAEDAVVLASRSEMKRGEWQRFCNAPFTVRPMGSVAYKLACVAAGLADATWTFVPKHEWDVAAGVALVMAARGEVTTLDGVAPVFNRPVPLFEGLVAMSAVSHQLLTGYIQK